jgi:hypothetical protein
MASPETLRLFGSQVFIPEVFDELSRGKPAAFCQAIKHLRSSGSRDAAVLIAAACIAVGLTALICVATALTPTDDPTTFAAAADNG